MAETQAFQLSLTTHDHDPFAVIELSGMLAGPTVYQLKHEFHRLIEYLGRNYVVVDLRQVSFIDSGGIGVVMYAYNHCKQMGGRLGAVEPANKNALGTLYQASLQRFIDFGDTPRAVLERICEKAGLTVPSDLYPVLGGTPAPNMAERVGQLEERLGRIESLLERIAGQST